MKKPTWLAQLINAIENYEGVIFYFLLVLLLWPIWANKYFLTLDGPSHLYNASVLLDYWRGLNTDFFSKYYVINHQIDPNWFSHIILASLMRFISPQLSEKVFLTSYILCFLLFSRRLILYINSTNGLISLVPFLFVYTHVFQMGFYNFSFSIALMMLILVFFLKYMDKWPSYIFIPLGALIFLLTYAAHPIGYLLGCGTLILIIFMAAIKIRPFTVGLFIKQLFRQMTIVFAAMLPSLLLFLYFIVRRPSHAMIAGTQPLALMEDNLFHLTAIVNLVDAEAPFAQATFIFMAILTVIAIVSKIYSRQISRFDVFFLITILLIAAYFKAPDDIGGIHTVYERYQIMPFFVLPFWLASVEFPKFIKTLIAVISTVLIVCLMTVRIPVHKLCSENIEEYVSIEKYIPEKSTVIPLSYSPSGKTPNGKAIADRTWIFFHAADYLGTEKPLIMMGNYEALTGYFPLIWRGEVNPFSYLSEGDGIEGVPPQINIARYEKETLHKVDYVLLLSLDKDYINHPNTLNLFKQLKTNYTRIRVSEHGRAILYKRDN